MKLNSSFAPDTSDKKNPRPPEPFEPQLTTSKPLKITPDTVKPGEVVVGQPNENLKALRRKLYNAIADCGLPEMGYGEANHVKLSKALHEYTDAVMGKYKHQLTLAERTFAERIKMRQAKFKRKRDKRKAKRAAEKLESELPKKED